MSVKITREIEITLEAGMLLEDLRRQLYSLDGRAVLSGIDTHFEETGHISNGTLNFSINESRDGAGWEAPR